MGLTDRRAAKQWVKRVLLPAPGVRRLRTGIGRGLHVHIDFSTQTLLYLGLYEVELNPALRKLAQPGYRSFDVGGQYGYDALVLAKLTGSEVISFEVDPELCGHIRQNVALNPELSQVRTVQGFVGARHDPAGGSVALDDVAYGQDGFVPDFIKIDIEGGEADALRGASRILEHARPNLLVEVHSEQQEAECRSIVSSLGYTPSVVTSRRWLREDRSLPHNRWLVAPASNRSTGPERTRLSVASG